MIENRIGSRTYITLSVIVSRSSESGIDVDFGRVCRNVGTTASSTCIGFCYSCGGRSTSSASFISIINCKSRSDITSTGSFGGNSSCSMNNRSSPEFVDSA
ncbi:unnamed protein product, partial [Schistosoma turkestanicum]